MLLKIFVVSVGHDPVQYKKELLEASNRTKSKTEQKHLLSLYKMMEEKKDRAPQWEFYMLLDFGKFDSYEEALSASQNYYEGFRDRLEEVGIKSRRLVSEEEIILVFRNAINPLKPYLGDIQ